MKPFRIIKHYSGFKNFFLVFALFVLPFHWAKAEKNAQIQVHRIPAGAFVNSKKSPRLGEDLVALYLEYQDHLAIIKNQGGPVQQFKTKNTMAPVIGDSVLIDLVASGDAESLMHEIENLGATDLAAYGRVVSARLPMIALSVLDKMPSVKFAQPAYWMPQAGSVTSQGTFAMNSDRGRESFSVDGRGVRVGILSDSYNCLGGAESGIEKNDLPSDITVFEEGPCAKSIDEGRAMMEIVHDVAPGAGLMFHTAVLGQASFAQGIIELADSGAQVITDDIGYLNEPFFQDGAIAQAVDTVNSSGVAYFSSAGNLDRSSYQSAFRPSGIFVDLGFGRSEAHDFDPGPGVDICQSLTIPPDDGLILSMQWDQPYFSVSGNPGSASDLDFAIADDACEAVVMQSTFNNIGKDPIEISQFTNSTKASRFNLMILRYSGPAPTLLKTIFNPGGSSTVTLNEFTTASSTSFGHSISDKGLGVAAANYRNTPRFGTRPPRIESFSSAGGTPILFDLSGNRLGQALIRPQPGITAPDGADTSFFGRDADGNGLPNFFGTSAAAPHAAGVAALMKNLNILLTPTEIYSALQTTAVDMDDPLSVGFDRGFDFISGFGLINTKAALESITPPNALSIPRGGWRSILKK